jgi:hypothetical protein
LGSLIDQIGWLIDHQQAAIDLFAPELPTTNGLDAPASPVPQLLCGESLLVSVERLELSSDGHESSMAPLTEQVFPP